jgi:hypothetical protein
MWGSVIYGVLLGLGFFLLTRLAPQPAGSLAWWLLVAVQLSWAASITWRRTKLPFATGAMLAGAAGATLIFCAILSGHEFHRLPIRWAVPVYGLMVAIPLCLLIESRAHHANWLLWKKHMEHKTALDILLGRHIPDLGHYGRN